MKLFSLELFPVTVLVLLLAASPFFLLTRPVTPFLYDFAVIVCAVLFLGYIIKFKTAAMPKSMVLTGLGLVLVVNIISAVFAGSWPDAFFGTNFGLTTVASVGLMAVLTYLVSMYFQSEQRFLMAHIVTFLVTIALGIFFGLRFLIGTKFASLASVKFFAPLISSSGTISNWNEIAIFFGVSCLLAVFGLEILRPNVFARFWLSIVAAISVFMLIIIHLPLVWMVVGSIAAAFFLYQLFRNNFVPRVLVIALVGLFFILPAGQNISAILADHFSVSGVNNFEVSKSGLAIYEIAREQTRVEVPTISTESVWGPGPNSSAPANLQSGVGKGVDKGMGVGFVPVLITETGLAGLVVWLIFFLALLVSGARAIVLAHGSGRFRIYAVTSTFVVALFLWVMNVFFVPSFALFFLTFFFTGLFVGTLAGADLISMALFDFGLWQTEYEIVASDGVGSGMREVGMRQSSIFKTVFAIFVCVLLLAGSLALCYVLFAHWLASV